MTMRLAEQNQIVFCFTKSDWVSRLHSWSALCPNLLKINRIINHLEDFSKRLEKIF